MEGFDRDDLFDAPHVGVVGATNSGKTTFAFHLFDNVPTGKAIFIHADPNESPDTADVRIDYERGDAWNAQVLGEGDRIDIVMPADEARAREVFAQIQSDLFALGREIHHDRPRFYVFVDEAHEYAALHADDENPLVRLGKRGRRFNCRLYIISQSPADVSKKALKQANFHVIFAMGTFSKQYFDTYHIPFEEVQEKIGKPDDHRFMIWDDYELHGVYKLHPEEVS